MTMAPFVDDEAILAGAFGSLRRTLEDVRRHDGKVGPELSMGMTDDFQVAIEEGATMVRVGRAIFDPSLPAWRKGGR
jgi:uncharacterized pyridoxal phosphate-containing UPF0001 family protein